MWAELSQAASNGSSWADWVPAAVAILGGGGVVGAIVAFIKVRPEAGNISVQASQGALIVQTGVIENLNKEIARANQKIEFMASRMEALEAEAEKVEQLRRHVDEQDARIEQLEKENKRLRNERDLLKERVQALEGELKVLKNGNGHA